MNYRRKEIIQAVRWTGSNMDEVEALIGSDADYTIAPDSEAIMLDKSVGMSIARVGDYIMRQGQHFYAMPKREFEQSFEQCPDPFFELPEDAFVSGAYRLRHNRIWRKCDSKEEAMSKGMMVHGFHFDETGISVNLLAYTRKPSDNQFETERIPTGCVRATDEVIGFQRYGIYTVIRKREGDNA